MNRSSDRPRSLYNRNYVQESGNLASDLPLQRDMFRLSSKSRPREYRHYEMNRSLS